MCDACVTRLVAHQLREILAGRPDGAKVMFLDEQFQKGEIDSKWAQVAGRENWIVISADRGRKNRGPKLPRLLRELNVFHVLLSAAVHKLPSHEKTRAIHAVWPDIIKAFKEGTPRAFALHARSMSTSFHLVRQPVKQEK